MHSYVKCGAGLAAGILIMAATAVGARADIIKTECGAPGGLSCVVPQLMAKYAGESGGYKIQVNEGQTLTKSALLLANDRLGAAVYPPVAFDSMVNGTRMYAKQADKVKAVAPNLRALFGFAAGHIHALTYADSGIETYDDLKGKRVFVGPPSGGAVALTTGLINVASGLKMGEDYEGVKMGWGAGLQAFEDGQFDAFLRPLPINSALMEQIGLKRDLRLIDMPDGAAQSDAWQNYVKTPGRLVGVIPANTYDKQVNKDQDIDTVMYTMVMGVHKDMDDQTAYDLTKAFWDNLDESKRAVVTLVATTADQPFVGLNTPLHPGAVKYYQEVGIDIPDHLMPPSS